MVFEPNINLGTLIAGAAVIVTILSLHTANRRRWERVEMKVDLMWRRFYRDYLNERGGDDPDGGYGG